LCKPCYGYNEQKKAVKNKTSNKEKKTKRYWSQQQKRVGLNNAKEEKKGSGYGQTNDFFYNDKI